MAINYNKKTWNADSYINPSSMNNIENGLKQACDGVDNIANGSQPIEGRLTVDAMTIGSTSKKNRTLQWLDRLRNVWAGFANDQGTWYLYDTTNTKPIILSTASGVNTFYGDVVGNFKTASATTDYGLTFLFYKQGRIVFMRVYGTTTKPIPASSSYVDLCAIPAGFEPAGNDIIYTSFGNYRFQWNITDGMIRFGYSSTVNGGTASDIPTNNFVGMQRWYISAN